jgi:hypothetical protein
VREGRRRGERRRRGRGVRDWGGRRGGGGGVGVDVGVGGGLGGGGRRPGLLFAVCLRQGAFCFPLLGFWEKKAGGGWERGTPKTTNSDPHTPVSSSDSHHHQRYPHLPLPTKNKNNRRWAWWTRPWSGSSPSFSTARACGSTTTTAVKSPTSRLWALIPRSPGLPRGGTGHSRCVCAFFFCKDGCVYGSAVCVCVLLRRGVGRAG